MNFKETRRNLMVLSNTVAKLKKSRELTIARTSLQNAMMWSGTFLKESGQGDNPYAKLDGKRTSVEDIEPMFEATSNTIDKEFFKEGEIVVIDKLREFLDELHEAVLEYVDNPKDLGDVSQKKLITLNMILFNVLNHITEARMWLGMELGRMRDESK